nr:hypothetical protein [Streptomyces sp. YIM 132580]
MSSLPGKQRWTAPPERPTSLRTSCMDVPWNPLRAKQRAAPSRTWRCRASSEDRVVYGAVVAGPEGPHVLTATAASPVVAQLPREAVTAAAPEGPQGRLTDVAAAPSGDPRGSALGASVLPPVLAGIGGRSGDHPTGPARGVGGSLLRTVAFFDGSAADGPVLTLALWAALGLTAVLGLA